MVTVEELKNSLYQYKEEIKTKQKTALLKVDKIFLDGHLDALSDINNIIDSIPTVSLPVVLCKDCKHLYNKMGYYCCRYYGGLIRISENSFCSYGERKANNEKTTYPN